MFTPILKGGEGLVLGPEGVVLFSEIHSSSTLQYSRASFKKNVKSIRDFLSHLVKYVSANTSTLLCRDLTLSLLDITFVVIQIFSNVLKFCTNVHNRFCLACRPIGLHGL